MTAAASDPVIRDYRELLAISRLLTSTLDRVVVLTTVVREGARLLHAEAAVLLLVEGETLRVAATYEIRVPDELRLSLGPELMARLRDLGRAEGLMGCVGAPLVLRGDRIGILAVYRRELEVTADHDEELLSALADQAAVAFDNARIYGTCEAQAAALRESEEWFRLALDEAPIGVALVGLDGRFLRVNNALCEIVGYSRDELTQLTFQEITPPDDIGADTALAHKLAAGEIPRYQLGKRYIRKDGTPVSVMLSGSVVRASDGAPRYFIAHVEDVTARKQAEALAHQTQERYELALRGADLAAWDWNIETGEANLSARWAEMRGFRLDEIRPHVDSWIAGIHPDDLEGVQKVLADYFEGRVPYYETEHRARTRSGEWIWIYDRGKVFVRSEDGRPLRMVGTELDITERKNAERERTRLHRRLQVVLDEAPVGIMLTFDGHTWQANGRAQTLFGHANAPSCDPSAYLDAILDADERPLPRDQFPGMRALRGERLERVEMRLRCPDGHLVPVLVNAAPIPQEGAETHGAVVAFEDISSLKDLERLRGEWSSLIAHDLRQPLSSIVLSAEVVAEQSQDNPGVQRRVQQIRDAARRLNRMIQDLLDFSRLEARQLRLHREVLELSGLVSSVSERLAQEAPDRHVDVQVRGAPALADIDPDRFEQIMENLLTNAIKYGAHGTPIIVEVTPIDAAITVAVTNYGPGIPAHHLPHLFQRFRTLEEARGLGIKGIGLGLYITRELVEAHGGRISVESNPGDATTFRITLPMVQRAELAAGLSS